jgi:hypothetical protein
VLELDRLGQPNAYALVGGIAAWTKAGYPTADAAREP